MLPYTRQALGGRLQLGSPDPAGAVEHLPLQVAEVDVVEVHDPERSHAGRGEIQGHG
jgi:hypothetical protein